MDFARKILNKYGWKEGDGLGKNNDGIAKPLRASMKFDNAGFGSDQAASDFNNHWWERVFNEAAGNVDVKANENGVSVELKNKDDSVEISTKGYSLKKLKKAKKERSTNDNRYDNFLQSATLTKSGDEIENPHKIAVADISVTQYKTLTDEELFRACGGRTAHKGARHGLKLSGKLSRIEQQEQELLAKMEAQRKKSDNKSNESCSENNSKKHKDIIHKVEAKDRVEFHCISNNITKLPKRKKNKASDPVEEESNICEKDKLKKNKRKLSDVETQVPLDLNPTDIPKKKRTETNSIPEESRKKLKKNKNKDTQISVYQKENATENGSELNEEKGNNLRHDVNNVKVKKNKNKKKQDESNINLIANVDTAEELTTVTTEKKKTKGKDILKYVDKDVEKKPKSKNKMSYD